MGSKPSGQRPLDLRRTSTEACQGLGGAHSQNQGSGEEPCWRGEQAPGPACLLPVPHSYGMLTGLGVVPLACGGQGPGTLSV